MDNPVRGRKLNPNIYDSHHVSNEIDNPVRGRKPNKYSFLCYNENVRNEIDNPVRGRKRFQEPFNIFFSQ